MNLYIESYFSWVHQKYNINLDMIFAYVLFLNPVEFSMYTIILIKAYVLLIYVYNDPYGSICFGEFYSLIV